MVGLIAQEVKRFWPWEHTINVVLDLREEGSILMGEHQPQQLQERVFSSPPSHLEELEWTF